MREETRSPFEVCAYCKQPITNDELPAVVMENGDAVHARCWNDYTLTRGKKPN